MLWDGSHEQILIPEPCVGGIVLFSFTHEVIQYKRSDFIILVKQRAILYSSTAKFKFQIKRLFVLDTFWDDETSKHREIVLIFPVSKILRPSCSLSLACCFPVFSFVTVIVPLCYQACRYLRLSRSIGNIEYRLPSNKLRNYLRVPNAHNVIRIYE